MGQKTNPIIFRLGKTKTWASQYFEKKTTETSIYSFKTLEIKNFIYKFFKNNELLVHNCKVYYLNENSLYIFVSFYLTFTSINILNSTNKKQNIKFNQNKIKKKTTNLTLKQNTKNYTVYQNTSYFNNLTKILQKQNCEAANKAIKLEKNIYKLRRINLLKTYKKYLIIKNYNDIKTIKFNNFLSKFFKSLHLFVNKNINIFLTVCQLNKNLKQNFNLKKTKHLKKKLVNLRKYEQNNFFKEGVNILFNCMLQTNSANLIADFIATQLQKIKRHNFFIKFVKATLTIFINTTFSNLKGIKIKIKGRFNGAPRAKHKIINIGKGVPNLTINSKIDYSEKTSYTSNGTFGIKVWTCEK